MPKFTRLASESPLEILTPPPARLEQLAGTYEFGTPDKQLVFRTLEEERGQGGLHTWLRGEEVHLVSLGSREFVPGWIRPGGQVELRCDEDVRVHFSPAGGRATSVELRRGGTTRAKGERRHE